MAFGKARSRRDSCGLEVRPDGTLILGPLGGISYGGSEVVGIRSRGGADGRTSSLSRQEKTGSRQGLSSLMKKRRRRDSFGLVVREDGTLSLEQLPRVNSSHSHSPNSNIGIQTAHSGGRELSRQASLNCGDSWRNNWRSSPQRTVRGRRDSFGLEVREDGTLSLERLISATRIDGDAAHSHHGRRPQTSPTRPDVHTSLTYDPGSCRCYSGSSRIIASENARRSVTCPRTSTTRGVGDQQSRVTNLTSTSRSEVELLQERVQRLEAELASRGRLPAHNSTDVPPAYESRRGSPQRQTENTARTGRERYLDHF